MKKHLHIIALNIPYPPNYGGVIDIYYKLTSLHRLGVNIILHCFVYDRPPAAGLEAFCEKVYYYKRRTGLIANLTLLPYNVYSRKEPRLIERLLQDNYPILFDGLHSCYYLTDKRLSGRLRLYREANIEHQYYGQLAASCREPLTRLFLLAEAWRFKRYEPTIASADCTLAISQADADYLRQRFPGRRIEFVPAFHAGQQVTAEAGRSDFILYHGKLSVFENERVSLFLIAQVFSKLDCLCVIAGMDPSGRIRAAAAPYPHIAIEANPTAGRIDFLTREAQVHLLVTFQNTGLKLKLLNSLFAGRHIVANRLMLSGSGLDALCHIADTPEEMIAACRRLLSEPFGAEEVARRQAVLLPAYSPDCQAERLLRIIDGFT
jgi:glycosyltransferase involved in cell wall biosynthesis